MTVPQTHEPVRQKVCVKPQARELRFPNSSNLSSIGLLIVPPLLKFLIYINIHGQVHKKALYPQESSEFFGKLEAYSPK